MHYTRREFLDRFLDYVGEAGDDDARNTAERMLNTAMTTLWLKHPWALYRSPVPIQITLTVDQRRYALPDYFGRLGKGPVRNVTKGTVINPLREGDLETLYPEAGTSLEVSSQPTVFQIAGVCGVHTQPAATGEELEALSDDADDLDILVVVTGDDENGRWTRAQVRLTGTTAVSLGTWSFVDEVSKAYPSGTDPDTELTSSRGTVTVRTAADSTELQKLFSQESAKEHAIFTLYPKPNAADVVAVPVIRKPKRLIYDADPLPDLWDPALWEEMLIQWQVNTGDLNQIAAMNAPRPAYLDLLAFENVQQPRARVRGYTGP